MDALKGPLAVWAATGLSLLLVAAPHSVESQAASVPIPFTDVRPILESVRTDLVPLDLRRAPAEIEAAWPGWVSQQDAAIRGRVAAGDEDSLIHLLLFGTSFTKAPRASERDLAALVKTPVEGLRALRARIDDFAAGIASPGTNERLQFAKTLVGAKGIDPATPAGRQRLREYLDERTAQVGGSVVSSSVLDPAAALSDKLTVFRDRGLSADTSIFVDLGIERALDAMKAAGLLKAGMVRRVGIIGPGLDFTDKLEGYDFYPEQTIQPFALIDSLLRLDLAAATPLEVTAFDVSPRVLRHLETARGRARAGMQYSLVFPRNTERAWSAELVEYWQQLGNWIGAEAKQVVPPDSAGRVSVRGVAVRPPVVLSVTPVNLNIVTERVDVGAAGQFDLIVATNILLYYDVFEQSLAAVNIASMLRPGGFLLTNNRIFELPNSPLGGVGFTDSTYMSLPGIGDTGDRVIWYQKQ
ncbi:MAG: hypothetical protein HOP16_15850 [Acidobacteria bacterium]|nr:hypothetical protein [Acidobacteriota bacterium]